MCKNRAPDPVGRAFFWTWQGCRVPRISRTPRVESLQQAEDGDGCLGADVYSAVRNHGCHEVSSDRGEVVPICGCLVRVVKFLCKITGVVGEQNPGPPVQRPNDSFHGAIRGDAGNRSIAAEYMGTLRGW